MALCFLLGVAVLDAIIRKAAPPGEAGCTENVIGAVRHGVTTAS
jgi:hypothetical protein